MCGITGFFLHNFTLEQSKQKLEDMNDLLSTRGPDDQGYYYTSSVALAHKRLSIQDITKSGHQPMESECKNFVLLFNGEIYNKKQLQDDLYYQGVSLKGNSDTEALLYSLIVFGIEKTIQLLIGMFAFVLYDKKNNKLFLVRDRIGIKPLYFTNNEKGFAFGSTLGTIRSFLSGNVEIDQESRNLFFNYNYIPAPHTAYKNVYKLIPGNYLIVDQKKNVTTKEYWKLDDHIGDNHLSYEENLSNLHSIIKSSIRMRLLSDVPVGALLSGGIDSSLVASIMQNESHDNISTFSIGFNESSYNEAEHAKKIANYLGTKHTEMYLDESDCINLIPKLSSVYDEPFADSSQIPTMLVSSIASKDVTVVLTGDGGDELFAGYNRYLFANKYWKYIHSLPNSIKKFSSLTIKSLPHKYWDKIGNKLPIINKFRNLGDKAYKVANILEAKDSSEYYHSLILQRNDLKYNDFWKKRGLQNCNDFITMMQYIDTQTYLPDDILCKVDRASMAYSLEARVPLLDHRIVEYAFSMKPEHKISSGITKKPLRDILSMYIPADHFERPKMGFGIPIGKWLNTSLIDWAENLLSYDSLEYAEVPNCNFVRKCWEEHKTSKRDWQYLLWGALMWISWHRKWI